MFTFNAGTVWPDNEHTWLCNFIHVLNACRVPLIFPPARYSTQSTCLQHSMRIVFTYPFCWESYLVRDIALSCRLYRTACGILKARTQSWTIKLRICCTCDLKHFQLIRSKWKVYLVKINMETYKTVRNSERIIRCNPQQLLPRPDNSGSTPCLSQQSTQSKMCLFTFSHNYRIQ